VVVVGIKLGGAANAAGLEVGSVIKSINGQLAYEHAEFIRVMDEVEGEVRKRGGSPRPFPPLPAHDPLMHDAHSAETGTWQIELVVGSVKLTESTVMNQHLATVACNIIVHR
jgi:hypothetical protein